MLENACLAVGKAGSTGGVYPEVLFEVAKHWLHLYEKIVVNDENISMGDDKVKDEPPVISFFYFLLKVKNIKIFFLCI
jgi:hypothetical protein